GRIRVASFGRDEFLRFHDGDWVEVTDKVRELHGVPGHLSKVTLDEADSALVLDTPLPPPGPFAFPVNDDAATVKRRTRVRRWDQEGQIDDTLGNPIVDLNAALATGDIPVPAPGTTIELEKGVGITFETPSGGRMRTGDYWIFVARTVDASVEELVKAPPCGIHHHYCRLALIHQPEEGEPEVTDCRDPLCCGCCCEITVRPGQSVQAAIDRIPALGGKVCLEPGVHRLRRPLLRRPIRRRSG
ncbi:MAG: right-handed parallel beta-helix repeat-containing protein, partial [bacterium]|nr:right-handed parallel beta-helix repeat-containing protein [bacterium]